MSMIPDPTDGLSVIENANQKLNDLRIDRVIEKEDKPELFSDEESGEIAQAGIRVLMSAIELEDMLPGIQGMTIFTLTRGRFWENTGIPGVKSLDSFWHWWDKDCKKRGLKGAPRSISKLRELDRVYYHHHFRLAKSEDDPLIERVGNVDKLDKLARDFTKKENHDELLEYAAKNDLHQVTVFAAEAKKIYDQNPGITVNVPMVERSLRKKREKPQKTKRIKASRIPVAFRGHARGNQYLKIVDTEQLDERTYRQTIEIQDE